MQRDPDCIVSTERRNSVAGVRTKGAEDPYTSVEAPGQPWGLTTSISRPGLHVNRRLVSRGYGTTRKNSCTGFETLTLRRNLSMSFTRQWQQSARAQVRKCCASSL